MDAKRQYYFGKEDTLLIKGVAILMMMYHHCFLDQTRFEGFEVVPMFLSLQTLMNTANFGKLCVAVFAFLSAYGMTISLKKMHADLDLSARDISLFYKKRYFNLMQGWLFVFALCQVFCWFASCRQVEIYGTKMGRAMVYFLLDGLGVADLFGRPMLIATWWYMSLANIIIIILPSLVLLYRKIGTLGTVLLAIVLPRSVAISYEPFRDWFLIIIFGMIFADKDWLARIRGKKVLSNPYMDKACKLALSVVALIVGIYLRERVGIGFFYEFRHSFLCLLVIYMAYEFLSPVKYLNSFLCFIGKHSMNIFLTHTLIRAIYFKDFIYGFKYPGVIVAVLFICSLAVSVFIELAKKISGYNRLAETLRKRWL